MSSAPAQPPVVVVTGPTGTGKTPLAIALAQRFGGEIINADSMQVFRFMDIGTAKPTPEQRAAVPHHLFDVVTPDVPYSAGRYAEAARRAAAAIAGRGRLPLLVGGTGLYIRAFLEGLIATGPPDATLRAELEAEQAKASAEGDPHRLHRRLQELDPASAERIHPNDARRITRALEIALGSGRSAARVRDAHGFGDRPYRVLHLAVDLERSALDARIDVRCKAMIDAGLLQEVRDLLARYGPELRPLQAIGYRHMLPVAQGADILTNALAAMQRDTRRFARRQRTWLRGVPEAVWMDALGVDAISTRVEEFLATSSQ